MRNWTRWGAALAIAAGSGACCSLPTYTPAFWNDGGVVQDNNNCYNYSNNKRTDTFAQPGKAAGITLTLADMQCGKVHAAAVADKIPAVTPAAQCTDTRCRIALVVAPGQDYHWYRLGKDGMWTHKPGPTQATNVDNSGNPITNPETADRGPYTDFCGYFCSCSDAKEGAGHENIK